MRNLIVGLAVSALFLWLSFRNVSLPEVLRGVAAADPWYLPPMLALVAVYFLARAWRWRLIHRSVPPPGLANLFSAIMIGALVNNLMPAKLGEVARAVIIGRKEKTGVGTAVGTIVVERVFDLLSLIFSLAAFFVFSSREKAILRSIQGGSGTSYSLLVALYSTIGGFAAFLAFILLLRFKGDLIRRFFRLAVARLRPGSAARGEAWLGRLDDGLRGIDSPSRALAIFLLSIGIWLLSAYTLYLGTLSFGLGVGYTAAIFTTIVLTLGVVLPPAPGGVGPIQFFCVVALAGYGVPRDAALGLSFVYNLVWFAAVTGLGCACLVRESLGLHEVLRVSRAEGVET